jgi:hypothetical protein
MKKGNKPEHLREDLKKKRKEEKTVELEVEGTDNIVVEIVFGEGNDCHDIADGLEGEEVHKRVLEL